MSSTRRRSRAPPTVRQLVEGSKRECSLIQQILHSSTGATSEIRLPVSIDYLYDVEEIAGVRPVRAVCEGTAVLRSTSTHSLGVRLEEA